MNINENMTSTFDLRNEVRDTPRFSGPLDAEDRAHMEAVRVVLIANGDPFLLADDASLPPF